MSFSQSFVPSFKDILVLVDSSPVCAERLGVAVRLAREHGAHLTGLCVKSLPTMPRFVIAQMGTEVIEVQRRYVRETTQKAKTLFLETINGADAEWVETEGLLQEETIRFARRADVVIASQFDPEADVSEDHVNLLERLVLFSGRPLVVLPFRDPPQVFGQRVLVAWNATREGARAVNDSLPMLCRAELVEIVVFSARTADEEEAEARRQDGEALAAHLRRHGVMAAVTALSSNDVEVGAAIEAHAAEVRADLLVMGAYGRSRLMELILGGTTRHMLRKMSLPILMSH